MQYISSEPPTFDTFYTRYSPLVYRILSGLGGACRDSVDDLMQETFFRAWKAYGRLDHSQNVPAWISQIARCVFCDFMRYQRRHRCLDVPLGVNENMAHDIPDDCVEAQITWVDVSDAAAHACQHLGSEDQQIIALLIQEATVKEIAEALRLDYELDYETCHTRIQRARRRFRRCYNEERM